MANSTITITFTTSANVSLSQSYSLADADLDRLIQVARRKYGTSNALTMGVDLASKPLAARMLAKDMVVQWRELTRNQETIIALANTATIAAADDLGNPI